MRILRSLIVPTLGLVGLLPLVGGCDYDEHHDYDHERRAYPAGYYERDGYWHRDHDWDRDRWHDRDDWRRDHY